MRVRGWIVLGVVVAFAAWATWRTGRGAAVAPPATSSGAPPLRMFDAIARAAAELEREAQLDRMRKSMEHRHLVEWGMPSEPRELPPRWVRVVDAVTGSDVEAVVEARSLALGSSLHMITPIPGAIVDRGAGALASAETGRFDLARCHGDCVVLRVAGYVETMLLRKTITDLVRLQPLVPLRWSVERSADVAPCPEATVRAGPRDITGAPLPAGFQPHKRGRWRRGDVEQVVGVASEGVLMVPPGRYQVELVAPGRGEAPWRSEAVAVIAPRAVTLRVAPAHAGAGRGR